MRHLLQVERSYALPSDFRGAHTSNGSPVPSSSEGSSFSGLFTRLEMGHIVMGSDGQVIGHHPKADEKAVQRIIVQLVGAGEQFVKQGILALILPVWRSTSTTLATCSPSSPMAGSSFPRRSRTSRCSPDRSCSTALSSRRSSSASPHPRLRLHRLNADRHGEALEGRCRHREFSLSGCFTPSYLSGRAYTHHATGMITNSRTA